MIHPMMRVDMTSMFEFKRGENVLPVKLRSVILPRIRWEPKRVNDKAFVGQVLVLLPVSDLECNCVTRRVQRTAVELDSRVASVAGLHLSLCSAK